MKVGLLRKKRAPLSDPKILLLSFNLLVLAFIQYLLMGSQIISSDRFAWQFFLLLFVSAGLSVLMYYIKSVRIAGFLIKIILFFLMIYPLGAYPWLGFSLLLSLLIELGFYTNYPYNIGGMICSLVLYLFLQTNQI